MVSITFITSFYYIYGWYYICGFYYIYGWDTNKRNEYLGHSISFASFKPSSLAAKLNFNHDIESGLLGFNYLIHNYVSEKNLYP